VDVVVLNMLVLALEVLFVEAERLAVRARLMGATMSTAPD
jgi:hypothetical protein